jgi:streptomycin 6-kinase
VASDQWPVKRRGRLESQRYMEDSREKDARRGWRALCFWEERGFDRRGDGVSDALFQGRDVFLG